MSISHLFFSSYWFSQPLIARGALFYVLLGFFGSIFLAGIVLTIVRFYEKDSLQQEIYKRCATIGLVMGFLGLIWFFFRQERIPFFAWRFWLIPWLPLTAYWIYRVVSFATKRVPAIRLDQQNRAVRLKYLPKKSN